MAEHRIRMGLTLPMIPMVPPMAKTAVEVAREFCGEGGYEEIWLAELNAGDTFALAGALSQAVPGVRLGTGVVPLQTRTPMVHAMAALTLHELTGGRFGLGVGISSENIVGDWGGQPFDRPLARMRDYLTVLRSALDGEKVQYEGETLSMKRFRLGAKPDGHVPILVGALNPRMLRLAGALADGVVLNMVPESAMTQVLGEVRAGAEEAGRDPGELEVVSRLHVHVCDDLKQGRALIRQAFGPYVATKGYNRFFRWIGMEQEAEAVSQAFAQGDRSGVAAAMSDRLCDAIGVTGDEGLVRQRIQDYARHGVDVCVLNPVFPDTTAQKAVLRSLPDAVREVRVSTRGVVRGAG